MTHICVGKLTIIGSDNGLSPRWRQAIIWTNARILLIGPLGTNFSETLIATETFSFKIMHLKISSAKWRPFCLGLNVLTVYWLLLQPVYHRQQHVEISVDMLWIGVNCVVMENIFSIYLSIPLFNYFIFYFRNILFNFIWHFHAKLVKQFAFYPFIHFDP